jgi:hypothetical protein
LGTTSFLGAVAFLATGALVALVAGFAAAAFVAGFDFLAAGAGTSSGSSEDSARVRLLVEGFFVAAAFLVATPLAVPLATPLATGTSNCQSHEAKSFMVGRVVRS